jgi:phosphoribosyl-ATP pyrophosphohydrolase/phosphoribosyl-AMP cyclohydrolase
LPEEDGTATGSGGHREGEGVILPDGVSFDERGLVTVVAQDRASGDVLMVAHANAEALARTAETGFAHFWSRSRGALWQKGETSGNRLRVREVRADCDRDALLFVVDPEGPACHTGSRTCFGDTTPTSAGILDEVRRVVAERANSGGDESYTARLIGKGMNHVLKKIGEEATEVVLAAKSESDERLAEETADLLFHVLVALSQREMTLDAALDVLRRRRRGK